MVPPRCSHRVRSADMRSACTSAVLIRSRRAASAGCGVSIQWSLRWRPDPFGDQVQRIGIDHQLRICCDFRKSGRQHFTCPVIAPQSGADEHHICAGDCAGNVARVGKERNISSGRAPTTTCRCSGLLATVTRPAPTRSAASAARRTAPGMPAPPPMTTTLPNSPLWRLAWSWRQRAQQVRVGQPQQRGRTDPLSMRSQGLEHHLAGMVRTVADEQSLLERDEGDGRACAHCRRRLA